MVPLATESYSRKMTGDAADDPVWDAFVDAMLALGATGEGGSRYGDKRPSSWMQGRSRTVTDQA